jgi:hypothetical protein
MFGFRGGESADTVSRKKAYMADAQQRWALTSFDLSTIETEVQLSRMVTERLGLPEVQVKIDVQAWMQGKRF